MEEKLKEYADAVKNHEYEELFPDSSVEQVKEDEEKVKEALFQVYGVIWNQELYSYCTENSHVTREQIAEKADDSQQFKRIVEAIGAVTVTENDEGEPLIPSSDVKYALTKRIGWWD